MGVLLETFFFLGPFIFPVFQVTVSFLFFFSFAAATARSEGGKRQRESKADEATVIYLYHS